MKKWAKIVELDGKPVLFTLRRDDAKPDRLMLEVQLDLGSFLHDADFGIARLAMGDLTREGTPDDFLDTFADEHRAEEAVHVAKEAWLDVQTEGGTEH